MAKIKPPTADDFEKAINKAIDQVPGARQLTEAVYCEEVGGALESILEGIKMREQEIGEDTFDDEDE